MGDWVFLYCMLYGMSPTMLISSESIQNLHHFGVSPTTIVFFVEEIWVITQIYVLYDSSNKDVSHLNEAQLILCAF